MKEVKRAADTLYGPHVVCGEPLEVGEQVLFDGKIFAVTEILHSSSPYRALGLGDTHEEAKKNAYWVHKHWARIDEEPRNRFSLEHLTGSGLPVGLPGEDD